MKQLNDLNRERELNAFVERNKAKSNFDALTSSYLGKMLVMLDDEMTEVINKIEGHKVGQSEFETFVNKTSEFHPKAIFADGVWTHPDSNQPTCIDTIFWKGKPILLVALFKDNFMIKSA